MTCRHVAQPIPHGIAPQQSPAMLRLRGKDSNMEQTSDIKPQIFSLQNDTLDYNSFFSACILTYTPEKSNSKKEKGTYLNKFLRQKYYSYKHIPTYYFPIPFTNPTTISNSSGEIVSSIP